MKPLLAIARIQLLRTARSRLILACGLVALLAASIYTQRMVSGATDPDSAAAAVVWDLAQLSSEAGFVLATLLATWSVSAEGRDRTWQALLSKPAHHWQIVVGKFLGVMATLAGMTGLLWVALHLLLAAGQHRYLPRLDLVLAFQLLGFCIPSALALCLSVRLHPIAAIAITLLLQRDALDPLFDAIARSHYPPPVVFVPLLLTGAAKLVAPDYGAFVLADSLGSAAGILWGRLGWIAAYGLAQTTALLSLSCFFLARKDMSTS